MGSLTHPSNAALLRHPPFPRWEGGNSTEIGCLQVALPHVNNQFRQISLN
jgi:hypothetical protein